MLHKFSFGLLCALSLTFFSCNKVAEKKSDNTAIQPNNSIVAPQTPSIDLTSIENKFAQDSLNYELRAMLAANYYSAGALDKAAYHFMKVYEHDTKNLFALSNLGNIYYDKQDDDKAIQFYEKALEIDAKNIAMRCDLATCYSRINKFKKAMQILRENIEMDKNHIQSHYNLSIILSKTGKTSEAAEEMKIYQKLKSTAK